MCGIFGFITKKGRGPDLGLLRFIAAATERRGRHAFGLSWIGDDGRLHAFKRPGAATDRLGDLNRCHGATVIVGHCRWATHGTPEDNRNNHPHRAGRGWLVHNGVVANYQRLVRQHRLALQSQCDSEVLGLLLARSAGSLASRAKHAVAAAEGRLALLGVWNDPPRLLFARNGNPLHLGETRTGYYFGSLSDGLPGSVSPLADPQVGVWSFENGSLRPGAFPLLLESDWFA